MTWPSSILPDYRPDIDPKEQIKSLIAAVRELQRSMQGGVSLAGLLAEEAPNADTAVVEVFEAAGTALQVDNPLDREPVGVLNIFGTGFVRPRVTYYHMSISITQGTKTLTTTDTFSSSMAGGYFISQAARYKIASYTNPTTLVLQDTFTEATLSADQGTIIHRWEPDSVWLYFDGMKGYYGYYRLLFF